MVPSTQISLTAYARILHHAKLSRSSSGSVGDRVFNYLAVIRACGAAGKDRYYTSHHCGEHKYKGQHREYKHVGRIKDISLS
jgi:hypothetical protein